MKTQIISVAFLFYSLSVFGQYDNYNIIIDSSDNYRLGDGILWEANYYKAYFYYEQLNSIDSFFLSEFSFAKKLDTTGLYYCLISSDRKNILLFFIEKLDSSKFTKDILLPNKYTYKDCNNLFTKSGLAGCYTYCLLAGYEQGNTWVLNKGNGSFWGEADMEKVKRKAFATLLGNTYYFQTLAGSEDKAFWEKVRKEKFLK